jgi:hypothetical protein
MKHIECVQNTEDWFRARLGKPTASEFKKIIRATGGLSAQRYEYMYQLIFERIYQARSNIIQPTYWMARGKAMEAEAATWCEEYLEVELSTVGLVTTDDGRLACSPDRIVDWTHAVEIKCPKPWNHIRYSVLGPQSDYFMQIHGIMYVGGFEKVSFFSYCPGMPCRVHEINRDDKLIKMLDALLPLYAEEVDTHEKAARALGDYSQYSVAMEPETAWQEEA